MPLKISVITPSLNQAEFIEETILSILQQDYPDFEHIIIDAGSTDGTASVVQRYPHVTWISEPDKGQAHAINKGLLLATGDIIAYLNSDDVYRKGAFRTVASVFASEPRTQVVVGNCDYLNAKSETAGFLKAKFPGFDGLLRYWGWDQWVCVPQPAVFMRRSLLAEAGLFDTRYQMVMDFEMWLRIAKVYPFRVIDQTLAGFRLSPHTKTVSRIHEMYIEERLAFLAHLDALRPPRRAVVGLAARRHFGRQMLRVAERYALADRATGRLPLRLVLRGLASWPLLALNPRAWLTVGQMVCPGERSRSAVRRVHRACLSLGGRLVAARQTRNTPPERQPQTETTGAGCS